jgi:hypothetical protein
MDMTAIFIPGRTFISYKQRKKILPLKKKKKPLNTKLLE